MRVAVPVQYTVKAIEFRHRDASTHAMFENVLVDVPDVSATDLGLALAIRSAQGEPMEYVYGYDGKLWVRDSRKAGDLPMLPQHVQAAGRKLPVFQSYHAYDQAARHKRIVLEVSTVGMLATKTGITSDYEYSQIVCCRADGVEFIERTSESERMRNVSDSTREERIAAAAATAWNDSIAVDGVFYRRVGEPSIEVKGNGLGSVEWRFGAIDQLNPEHAEKWEHRSLYVISPKDIGKVAEWFGDEVADKMTFSMEVYDERYFTRPTDRMALLVDADRLISAGVSRKTPTGAVMKWCELRDAYEGMWARGGKRLERAEVLALPDEAFEGICVLVEEYVAESHPENDLKGIEIWNSRSIGMPTLVHVKGPGL